MLVNISGSEECRIAVIHDGKLEELFMERQSSASHVGNIYKGRVTNVEPSIQAVFVDFGLPRNGFLHISDVHTRYFPDRKSESEDVGRKIARRDRPPIQTCLRRGQEVIVQITKEGVGTKGPTLTTYLSIPGRYLVMMPGMSKLGVSRRIEDDAVRREMRDILNELVLPDDMGFILRTAGMGQNKRELQRDLNYLTRLWKTIEERNAKLAAPVELYRESDLVTRTIRDVYTSDYECIVVDDPQVCDQVEEFLRIATPRTKGQVVRYDRREPLFHHYGIEEEIARLNSRHVPLPSGGSLVIDSHEAMVTIDVNSGRFRSPDNAEETALRIDLEAAEEIARQLRLRDLGGLIVCDFIDMRLQSNCRKVVNALKNALKKHKERARVLNMSPFGLVEITRQRQRPSIMRSIYQDCPCCKGRGMIKTAESMTLDVTRFIQFAAYQDAVCSVRLRVSDPVAHEVLNRKRAHIHRIESETGKRIVIEGRDGLQGDQIEVECLDERGNLVELPGFSDLSQPVGAAPAAAASRAGRYRRR
ncbi:MAG: Rne/Rng family ribonuclease [Phycisphaerales bacterium]|nr:MAG: Rne/Rng family ribonuclease [Phycisphaerales bacterium]